MYPNDLLREVPISIDTGRHWFALHTKPRQEKAMVRELIKMAVPCYLPLYQNSRLVKSIKVDSYIPLFPSYLFLYGDGDERLSALKTNRIVNILPVEDQQRLRNDLVQIQELIESKVPLSIESRLQAGRRVRIRDGAMRGLEGVLIDRRGEKRVIVAIDFLQQGASVAVEDFLIEAID